MDLESLKTELEGKKSQSELKVKIEAREALISELAQKIPDQLNYPHIINQLEAQKKHLRRLKKNYKREGVTEEAYRSKKTEISQEIHALKQKLKKVLRLAHDYLSHLRERLHALENKR